MEHQGVVNHRRLACVLVKDIYLERCGCAFCLGDWDGCDGESRRTEVSQRSCSEHSEPCLLSLAECNGILFISGEGDGKVVIWFVGVGLNQHRGQGFRVHASSQHMAGVPRIESVPGRSPRIFLTSFPPSPPFFLSSFLLTLLLLHLAMSDKHYQL